MGFTLPSWVTVIGTIVSYLPIPAWISTVINSVINVVKVLPIGKQKQAADEIAAAFACFCQDRDEAKFKACFDSWKSAYSL